jgi:hypothetical protein
VKKIPTLFVRDENDRRYVTEAVTPGCEWVLASEGTATRKYDGTCVMCDDDGRWWARREVKPGKTPPPGFQAVATDETTGKTVGWEPMEASAFAKFHAEAVERIESIGEDDRHILWAPGTFELVGPRINGNPERLAEHQLQRHSMAEVLPLDDRSFVGLRQALLALNEADGCEGVVFHHEDGRMAKLKARDFPRPQAAFGVFVCRRERRHPLRGIAGHADWSPPSITEWAD